MIIIINFSQTFCPFVLSPQRQLLLLIVCWTSCETSQCRNFTQGFFASVCSTVGILIS